MKIYYNEIYLKYIKTYIYKSNNSKDFFVFKFSVNLLGLLLFDLKSLGFKILLKIYCFYLSKKFIFK